MSVHAVFLLVPVAPKSTSGRANNPITGAESFKSNWIACLPVSSVDTENTESTKLDAVVVVRITDDQQSDGGIGIACRQTDEGRSVRVDKISLIEVFHGKQIRNNSI